MEGLVLGGAVALTGLALWLISGLFRPASKPVTVRPLVAITGHTPAPTPDHTPPSVPISAATPLLVRASTPAPIPIPTAAPVPVATSGPYQKGESCFSEFKSNSEFM
jgi:hypothetical protein